MEMEGRKEEFLIQKLRRTALQRYIISRLQCDSQ